MCEVFNRLKQIGAVKGKSCPIEPDCQKHDIPPDDFVPIIHCVTTGLVRMQESDLREQSAEELIASYQNATQK